MTLDPSPDATPAADPDTRPDTTGAAFGWAAWVLAAATIETIIGLRFNLLQYPPVPLGFAEITWARALTLIGLVGLVVALVRLAGRTGGHRLPLTGAILGLAVALADAMPGVNLAALMSGVPAAEDPASVPMGAFVIRVVPLGLLVLSIVIIAGLRRAPTRGLTARWVLATGLAIGLIGMLAVLPGIPFRWIGIGDYNLRSLFADDWRVFRTSFRIGPAGPAEVYYAAMFFLSTLVATLVLHTERPAAHEASGLSRLLGTLDWVALAAVGFTCAHYAYVGVEQMTFTTFQAHVALIGCLTVLYLCYRLYGAALALCGLAAMAYFFFCSYMPGIFRAEYGGYTSLAENLWYNNSKAVLGSQLGILLNNVLPFIIFGALLSATGAAGSLIRISFSMMRHTRGGPAHAAVMASGLFGSVSGSAVSNVVGTGVITIPMIKKRGFSAAFAGGVEATASTGGQIMPPIMGAAALVMADLTGAGYLSVMIAAIIPALAYYLSLFVNVIVESRRLGMQPQSGDQLEEVTRQDWINVIMLVFLPLMVVIERLIQGASPAGSAVVAILVVIALSPLSPLVRRKPSVLLEAIAEGGSTFGRLLMVVGVVGIIVGVMSTTDLPSKIGREIADLASIALVLTLIIAALVSLLLGMGMPTLPAYLTVVIILGPALNLLGLSPMTTHMFVFYFGVASAITPPVAVAAFAAAAIAGARPMATGVAAVRIGAVIFAVPFIFALNPDLLVVQSAFVEESGRVFSLVSFVSALLRTALIVWLLATAAGRFDLRRLPGWEALLRLAAAVLAISPDLMVHGPAVALGLGLLVLHRLDGKGEEVEVAR
ncbi:MAG: TRAP transporter permease [Qingshengfaniella sp.]